MSAIRYKSKEKRRIEIKGVQRKNDRRTERDRNEDGD
jgi:hypothetical protein